MDSIEDFYIWLNRFVNFEKRPHSRAFCLDVIRFYAAIFSQPYRTYKTVHIAGSKGKGSVAAMLAALLADSGQRTGLYTSPHVNDFRERITESGRFFDDESYLKAFRTVQETVEPFIGKAEEPQPTWFELLTLTAFVLFRQEKLEWAVFETGMGGRLDATNIIEPEITILTPIELEHCEYLGDSIPLIAAEKAGIIKHSVPVFCSKQEYAALEVFKKTAARAEAPFFYIPEAIKTIDHRVTNSGLELNVDFFSDHPIGSYFTRPIRTVLPLFTPVQAGNAVLAALVFKYLYPDASEELIEKGLAKAWLPARFQILQQQPLMVVDGAHTHSSVYACAETFFSLTDQKAIVVFACAKDKNPQDMLSVFLNRVSHLYLTIPGVFKKGDLNKSIRAFEDIFEGKKAICMEASEDFESVLTAAFEKSNSENKPLLITGSFYLAAEAQRIYSVLGFQDPA